MCRIYICIEQRVKIYILVVLHRQYTELLLNIHFSRQIHFSSKIKPIFFIQHFIYNFDVNNNNNFDDVLVHCY